MKEDGALVVADAEVHGPGMEIDAAVKSVLLVVESHDHCLSLDGAGLEPASWLKRASLPKIPRWATASAASLYNPWDEPGPSQGRQ